MKFNNQSTLLNRIFPGEVLLLVAIMWVVFLIDLVLPGLYLTHLGIQPRKLEGLTGIFLSPFLHGGLSHILSNTIPLLLLSAFLCLSIGSKKLLFVMFSGVVCSGLGTWLFGSSDLVIGASGLVFSLIGFIFADAWFSPNLRSWTVAILAFVLYGSTVLSLFVFLPFVSWAAHFWGFSSGIAIALLMRHSTENRAVPTHSKTENHHPKGRKT